MRAVLANLVLPNGSTHTCHKNHVAVSEGNLLPMAGLGLLVVHPLLILQNSCDLEYIDIMCMLMHRAGVYLWYFKILPYMNLQLWEIWHLSYLFENPKTWFKHLKYSVSILDHSRNLFITTCILYFTYLVAQQLWDPHFSD